jgi:protein phosphatase
VHAGADDLTEGTAAGALAPGADLDEPTVAVQLADLATDPPTQTVPVVTAGPAVTSPGAVTPAPGTAAAAPAAPGAGLPPTVGDERAPGRRERRRAAKAASGPRARLVTVRVVAFLVLLLAILAVAGFGTEYYARSTYYVGLSDGRVTIFQGRPGGVLWWKPTVSEVTPVGASGVLPYHLPALRSGVQESSLSAARAYVTSLRTEKAGTGSTGTFGDSTTTVTTVAP